MFSSGPYYFVEAAFPPLTLGQKPEISFKELKEMLVLNLSKGDLKKFNRLLAPIDLYNLKALWMGLPLDDRGVLPAREMEEALLVRENLPAYLSEFLERYESTAERLKNFAFLYAGVYRRKEKGFLGRYYQFEREFRLCLTALRAKKAKRDLTKELQFEDPYDPFVAEILAQKDALDYTPPLEYEELKALFEQNQKEPKKLAFALLKFRFEKIGEIAENEHFTLDGIMSYAEKLLIVENWSRLNQAEGNLALEGSYG